MTDLGRIIKYKIVNDRWIYSGPILLSIFVYFGLRGFIERDVLNNNQNVRYTLCYVREFSTGKNSKWFKSYFWVDNKRYSNFTGFGAGVEPSVILNNYLWIKYSTIDPNVSELLNYREFEPLKDSVSIPEEGFTESDFKNFQRKLKLESQ